MMNKLLSVVSALGLGLGLALLSGPATAGVTWYQPITAFEDDDLDWIFTPDGEGGWVLKSSGTLDVGDRVVSVVEFTRTFGVPTGGPTDITPEELTGIADITVAAKSCDLISGICTYLFSASGANGILSGEPAGAMVAMYLDGTPDLDVINGNCGTDTTCIPLASNGDPFAVVGTSDADDFWFAQTNGDSLTAFKDAAATSKIGTFNFGLSVLTNNTGWDAFGPQDCSIFLLCSGDDGMVQVIGSGDFLGGQGLGEGDNTSNALARSDADFQVAPLRVPEPGTIALFGAALLGAFGGLRRKTRA